MSLSYVRNNPSGVENKQGNICIEQDELEKPPSGWNSDGVSAAEGERTRPLRTAHPQTHWSAAIPNKAREAASVLYSLKSLF